MTITFVEFLNQIVQNPVILIIVGLILGVILVNGWTDAPNAIATCVSTRTLSPKKSIIMATIFNFLGVLVMTLISRAVAQTVYNMVDFGNVPRDALIALCAALFAIVIWAVAAWIFGIPTSESHALIAGISGAAIAIQGGIAGINGNEWIKVIYGLVLSTVMGFVFGYLITKLIEKICKNIERQKTIKFFKKTQIVGAASMAFMHGAQDGQKFMGVFMLCIFLANGYSNVTDFTIPIWLMILCSLIMSIGTSIGGYKIIKTVGMGMVKLETYQGAAADLAGASCLLVSSVLGLPVSTTHTKTTSIMGVGASKRLSCVNWSIVKEMTLAWILTFPSCGLLGFMATYVFIRIF
ncbi:MAG: inorganic phosphate transporter [Clostridia bacterium]|nr:inorganic phosphate transporter [Clostridia bacterium]